MKRKKPVYLKAAELLVTYGDAPFYQHVGCCYVINSAANTFPLEHRLSLSAKFEQLFRPEANGPAYWFGDCQDPEANLARSLALLLMYEMGEG